MTLVETYLPFGIRDVKITPFIGELGVGTPVDLPVGRVVTFRETESMELLKSDDRNVAMEGTGALVEWELEAGGISFEAWQILTGASLVTGVGFRELIKLDTDVRPYFVIEGQSINDDGSDIHVLIRRCKVNGSVEGTFEEGQFLLTKCEGLGIGDSTGELWRMRWNTNPTEVFGGVRALPNTITLLARPLTLSVGNVVAGTLAAAVTRVEANKLQVGLGAEVIVAMQPKTVQFTAQPLSASGGVGALSLAPRTIAVQAQPLTVSRGITIVPKAIAITARPLSLASAPGVSQTIEAELGTVGGGAQIVTDFPGYTGTGYIGYFGLTGDVNQIVYNTVSGGLFTFSIRFGNAHQPASTTVVNIRVNGSIAGTINLQNTANEWSNPARFVQSTAISIPLNAGNNTIRIEHAGLEYTYADIDSYTLTGSGGVPPTPVTTGVRIGATWTSYRPSDVMNSTIAVMETQAQHIIGFGTTENPAHELNPSPGVYNWDTLDFAIQDIIDAGATKPIIILCRAPGWMKPASISTTTQDDWSIAPARRADWAALCAAVATRYNGTGGMPKVDYFSFWNEMKGYWVPHKTSEVSAYNAYAAGYGGVADNGNRWHYERYTLDFTATRNAVRGARPEAKVGGPYVILRSGATAGALGADASTLTFPGGVHDKRHLDVMQYFVANATFDFLSCDGGLENQVGTEIPNNPNQQIEKLWGFFKWVRTLGGPAETCELINFETYMNQTGLSPWNYTEAQKEDLFIELCRQTSLQVPVPNVSYLTWFSPGFRPQVVARGGDDFTWANTASGFASKVATWHGATPTPPTPEPGTSVDMLALFKSIYPAGGAEIWVDGALGNDGNAGGSTSPKATIQAAINAAGAGSNIMVRPYGPGYSNHTFENKAGTASNYIRMISSPVGAKINANGGSYNTSCTTNCFGGGCHHIAIYGFEYAGINSSGAPYESGVAVANGAHDVAVWKCYFHDLASHGVVLPGDSGQGFSGSDKIDFCYNRLTKIAQWNPFQSSGFSTISMVNIGTAWPDGYHNRLIGNVIDGCGTDNSIPDPAWGITDGNSIILDYSGGYSGKFLVAHNLCVGAGGRGVHALGTHNVDIWFNTSCDSSWNIAGSWIGELSVTESNNSRCQYNVAAARPGNNRVSIFYNSSGSTWSDNVFLRGSGGSDSGDISVNANNNVNKLATGPSGYFQNYQAGTFRNTVITNAEGFRPTTAQVAIVSPPTNVRNAIQAWPDPAGYLRPSSGAWAYGAFEATTTSAPGGGGGNPVFAPVAEFLISPSSGIVGQTISFTDQTTNAPTAWAWNFGDGNTSNVQNPSKSYSGAATYNVALQASNSVGSSSRTHSIVIGAGGGGGGTPDYVVGVNGSLQQILELSTSQLAGKRILIPSGLWLGGDHGIWFVNKDFGNVVVEFQSGAILRGPGTSGIELYGSSRNIIFTGPGKVQGNGGNTVSEGIFISSVQGGKGGDGNPGGNIIIDGLTIEPTPGTGALQRNGVGIWGCDWVTVRNCTIHDASSNAAFGFGGAGSGISIGQARRGVAGSGAYHVLLENNHVYNQLMIQDGPSADRNGIILDLYHCNGGFQNFGGLYADRLIGETMIRNNDIHDVSGRGIQVLFGGQPNSKISVLNNQVHGQWARHLGGSSPETAIGGNGTGVCENVVCSNNTVTTDPGNGNKPAFFFFDFNPGTGVTGSNNHVIGGGNPYDWHNSPGTAPPAGFIT